MKLLILGFLLSLTVSSYGEARCSKGYSTVEKAEAAVAAYFEMENLDWCKDIDKGERGTYAEYKMVKECEVKSEAEGEIEVEKYKISIMEVFAGPCALDGVMVSIGMYTYEYNTDIDPNIKEEN
ncbi:MAG: hypothetical protein ACRBBP_05095 [Bdellovibrionales bacterium]